MYSIEKKEIERFIIKSYRKELWKKFLKAINDFNLIEEGDKVLVAISGGKDSILLAKMFEELKKHSIFNFDVCYVSMDPGFTKENREKLEELCKFLGIDIQIFETDIFQVAEKLAGDYPCYMCARMRRGALYGKAKELGCNKVALGHHMNDVVETTLMNMLYAGTFKTMRPILDSQNFEGLKLIRPMYYIREDDIKRWLKRSDLKALDCACSVTKKRSGNIRYEIKDLVAELMEKNNMAERNILNSAMNINLDSCIAWEKDGKKFLLGEEIEK